MTDGQSKPTKHSLSLRLGLILLVMAGIWILSIFSESSLVPVGSDAPPWQLRLVGAEAEGLALESLRGKVVVLDFWSVSCPPCVHEVDVLEALWQRMKAGGVTVVGVAAWGETEQEVQSFRKRKGATYPMLLGTDEMVGHYKVTSLPTLYIIDRNGKIAASHQGYWDLKDLESTVAKVRARE